MRIVEKKRFDVPEPLTNQKIRYERILACPLKACRLGIARRRKAQCSVDILSLMGSQMSRGHPKAPYAHPIEAPARPMWRYS